MSVRFGIGTKGDLPPERWADLVRQVESAGFDSLWVADERLYRDVYAVLAQAAAASQRLRLGTAVTNPYVRPPALTAASIATVDELSGGRTVLGLGAGGSATGALGIARRHPARALREAITIIRDLTAGQRVEVDGLFSFRGRLDFTPLRPVPVWLAARGPRLLELGGEVADGVIIGGFASETGLRFARERIAVGARRGGRQAASVPCTAWIYAAAHEDEAAARSAVGFIVALSIIASRPVLGQIGVRLPGGLAAYLADHDWSLSHDVVAGAAPLLSLELIEQFSVSGTPEACRRRLAGLMAEDLHEIALLVYPVGGQSIEEAVEMWRGIVAQVRS